MCLWGAGARNFFHQFHDVKLLCVSGGGGGVCNVIAIFVNSSSCVSGGGGLHFYQSFTWMCSNVCLRHDKPNKTSDFRLYTHSCSSEARGVHKGCRKGAKRVLEPAFQQKGVCVENPGKWTIPHKSENEPPKGA